MIDLTDSNFKEEVLDSNIPVLVDFWATWCAPCKVISPIIDMIAEEYNGKIKVVKFNVDQSHETIKHHTIRNVPTLVIFKNGNEIQRLIGFQSKKEMDEILKKVL